MILIVVEHANGKVSKSTWEVVTAARELAQQKESDTSITALVLGSNIAPIAAEIARAVDQVLVADLPALTQYDSELWSAAVAQIAREGEASIILIGASRSGREYSPRVAIKLDAPLLEDVISLKAAGDTLTAKHYTFLARVTETIEATGPTAVVTIKPGVFNPAAPRAEAAEQFDVDLNLPTPCLQVTGRTAERSSRVGLTEAEIVVSGGRGVGSAEGFTQYVEALADQLGGCSRSHPRHRRCRVASLLRTGRPNRKDRPAQTLHRDRHLRRSPAPLWHEQEQNHSRHQPRRRSPHLQNRRLRHRRRRPPTHPRHPGRTQKIITRSSLHLYLSPIRVSS